MGDDANCPQRKSTSFGFFFDRATFCKCKLPTADPAPQGRLCLFGDGGSDASWIMVMLGAGGADMAPLRFVFFRDVRDVLRAVVFSRADTGGAVSSGRAERSTRSQVMRIRSSLALCSTLLIPLPFSGSGAACTLLGVRSATPTSLTPTTCRRSDPRWIVWTHDSIMPFACARPRAASAQCAQSSGKRAAGRDHCSPDCGRHECTGRGGGDLLERHQCLLLVSLTGACESDAAQLLDQSDHFAWIAGWLQQLARHAAHGVLCNVGEVRLVCRLQVLLGPQLVRQRLRIRVTHQQRRARAQSQSAGPRRRVMQGAWRCRARVRPPCPWGPGAAWQGRRGCHTCAAAGKRAPSLPGGAARSCSSRAPSW